MADCKKYDRTANLIDYNYLFSDDYDKRSEFFAYYRLDVLPNTQYTLSSTAPYNAQRNETTFMIGLTNVQSTSENGVFGTKTVTTDSNGVLYVAIRIKPGYIPVTNVNDYMTGTYYIMLNTGSTALPYQPYLDWKHSLRKLTTATDTITTLPAVLYPNDTTATVGLKGNMEQSGTPTPTTPIQPSETGERTGNLWSNDNATLSEWISSNGEKTSGASATYGCTLSIPYRGATHYTIKYNNYKPYSYSLVFYDSNGDFIIREHIANPNNIGDTIIVPNGTASVIAQVATNVGTTLTREMLDSYAIMLNSGNTALPYEPYGYKLTISSASTTTPIYLGGVQTTRKVKKYEFTGNEAFTKNDADSTHYLYYGGRVSLLPNSIEKTPLMCNELPVISVAPQTQVGISSNNKFNVIYLNFGADVMNAQPSGNTVDGLKEYLAARYAAGTPVCIWYVLVNETTGIVNEPLRKIGTYADTVSGITIPTITGKDTFDVLTTLKPSEVELTYTGWHDAVVKEFDGSDWQ